MIQNEWPQKLADYRFPRIVACDAAWESGAVATGAEGLDNLDALTRARRNFKTLVAACAQAHKPDAVEAFPSFDAVRGDGFADKPVLQVMQINGDGMVLAQLCDGDETRAQSRMTLADWQAITEAKEAALPAANPETCSLRA